MSAISGGLRKLSIRRSTDIDFIDVGHVVSDSWSTQAEMLETTTRENNGFRSYVPAGLQSTINATCVLFQDADLTSKIGYKDLRTILEAQESIEYKLEIVGENYLYYGVMYIESLGDTADVSDLLTFEIAFRLTSQPVLFGDDTAPTAPFLNPLLVNTNGGTVTLSWTGATDDVGVVGYVVSKFDTGQPEQIINVGNVLFWTDSAIVQGRTYGYNVRAYDAIGNESPDSNKRLFTYTPVSGVDPVFEYILQENGETIELENNGVLIKEI